MAKKKEKETTQADLELPAFNFGEVQELYEHDLSIPDELYDSLLLKDRKLLIEDLEKVLQHAVEKYKMFSAKNYPEKKTFFVWHSVFLLNDMKAYQSLPALLSFLQQDEEVIGFYLGDGISSFGWEIFFTIGNQNVRLLVDFCKSLQDDWISRTEAIEALKQIALHEPERRLEIESYLRELLLHVASVTIYEDAYIDDMADKVLETIGQLCFSRLFPEVKNLFEQERLPVFITGWKDFERQYVLAKFEPSEITQEIQTRKEIYTSYLEAAEEEEDDDDYNMNWYDDVDDDVDDYLNALDKNDAYEDSLEEAEDIDLEKEDNEISRKKSYIDFEESHTPFVKKEPDVGRNDPCPCGSGKKYKKCHGKS